MTTPETETLDGPTNSDDSPASDNQVPAVIEPPNSVGGAVAFGLTREKAMKLFSPTLQREAVLVLVTARFTDSIDVMARAQKCLNEELVMNDAVDAKVRAQAGLCVAQFGSKITEQGLALLEAAKEIDRGNKDDAPPKSSPVVNINNFGFPPVSEGKRRDAKSGDVMDVASTPVPAT